MKETMFDIITNKDKLQQELSFYSLFLMTFEHFLSVWKETALDFYANSIEKDEDGNYVKGFTKPVTRNGKTDFVRDQEKEKQFRNKVYQRVKKRDGNYDRKLSLFDWMVVMNAISPNDYNILKKCYLKRNEYAHNIVGCLNRFVTAEEKDLLRALVNICIKASQNWVSEVEIPTNPDEINKVFLDRDGNFTPPKPDEIITPINLFYSLVLSNLDNIL